MIEVLLVAGFVACVLAAAGLALAEVALIRVRRPQVAVAADTGDRRATALLALLDDLPVVVNTVLLVVLLVQVGAATIVGVLAARWFGGLGVSLASVAVTVVLFVYTEALPKTRAVHDPRRWALRVTPMLRPLVAVFRVPVTVLVRLADLQSGSAPHFDAATEAELRSLAREAAEVGEIEPGDAELVERSFRFGDRTVGDVMVPRRAIRWVTAADPVAATLSHALEHGHRRLPVVGSGLDDVVGVVRLRDVAAAARDDPERPTGEVIGPVLWVDPAAPIAAVLEQMQQAGTWLALARGDEGRTAGLVTIEDIVAELVGEIADDHHRGVGSQESTVEDR